MTYEIEANWTQNSIDRLTCDEMKDIISNQGNVLALPQPINVRLPKAELRQLCYMLLDVIQANAKTEAEAAEAARQAKIAAERADEKVIAGLKAISEAFQSLSDSSKAVIVKFQDAVAKADPETNAVCHELEWRTDDVFLAYARMEQYLPTARFYAKQAAGEGDQYTVEELKEYLAEHAKSLRDRLTSVSISSSTNPVANVRSICELKAIGEKFRAVETLIDNFDEIVSGYASRADRITWSFRPKSCLRPKLYA